METPVKGEENTSIYKPPEFRIKNRLNNSIEFNKAVGKKIENYTFKRTGPGKYVVINKLTPKKSTKFEFKNEKGEVLTYSNTSKLIGDIFVDKKGKKYYILPENRTAHLITNKLNVINFIKEQIMNKLDLSMKFSLDTVKKSNKYGIYLEFLVPAEKVRTFFTPADNKVVTGKTSKKEVSLSELEEKALKQVLIDAALRFQQINVSKTDKELYSKSLSLIYTKDSSIGIKLLLGNSPLSDLEPLKKDSIPFFKRLGLPCFLNGKNIVK